MILKSFEWFAVQETINNVENIIFCLFNLFKVFALIQNIWIEM